MAAKDGPQLAELVHRSLPFTIHGAGIQLGCMWDVYCRAWLPFGALLTDMEAVGMAVDRSHLAAAQQQAQADQQRAQDRFRRWAARKVGDAQHMNVGSGAQVQTLLFAGAENRDKDKGKDPLPLERVFKIPNAMGLMGEKDKRPKKMWDIRLHSVWGQGTKSPLTPEVFTPAGEDEGPAAPPAAACVPACSTPVLKGLAGKAGKARKKLAELGLEEEAEDLSVLRGIGEDGGDATDDEAAALSLDDGELPWPVEQEEIEQESGEKRRCLLEWEGEGSPPLPLLKDLFASERRKAKVLNFSIAYGKTAHGLSKDWKVSLEEAKDTVDRWYADRPEIRKWQDEQRRQAQQRGYVTTILGRRRQLPDAALSRNRAAQSHALRAAINTPIQGSAADIATAAMLRINEDEALQSMGWRLLLQVHDEVILEGPRETAELARERVVACMRSPFTGLGPKPLLVDLVVDAKHADTWYEAK
ncbi:hypothetical protein CHLNCDRAFT_134785 [Chlorella variabilis]|uniref:DNA-directed DNA polymerase family A palm domain-containing protein n=1 Tax=Chlorella variabilis TaxID=554065 RepID=E1ZGS2_CHLVA|nr:hypothetical protein CHLNCDRAFT_134785 [Chlorella variabilis]EFN54804.1 hypothetical protein CHLNCDRAFT_134785 [Chlorella variabilis]|eukprot:XP_005846906.1 hypothetical protein CHLNCDRAFT_134785 [Chlorella variabilis]